MADTDLFQMTFAGVANTLLQNVVPELGSAFTRNGGPGSDLKVDGTGNLLMNSGGARSDYDNVVAFADGYIEFWWDWSQSSDVIGIRFRTQGNGKALAFSCAVAGPQLYVYDPTAGTQYRAVGSTGAALVGGLGVLTKIRVQVDGARLRMWVGAVTDPVFDVTDTTGPTHLASGSMRLEFNATGGLISEMRAGTAAANVAPTVTTHPTASPSVGETNDLVLTSAASGVPSPTVQWRRNTGSGYADISGATSPTFTESAVTLAMNGWKYRARWTNSQGSVDSNESTLTVTAMPGVDLSAAAHKVLDIHGNPQPGVAVDVVFTNPTTDVFVAKKSVTTDSNASLGVVKHAALTVGATYEVKVRNNATGERGIKALVAS